MIPDADCEAILATLEAPKLKRGMIRVGPPQISSSPPALGFHLEGRGRESRIVAWQRSSFSRRPLAMEPAFGFVLDFVKEKIEFAGKGVAIQLLVPLLLVAKTKPLGDAAEFIRRQTVNCSFDLLHMVHARSLTFAGSFISEVGEAGVQIAGLTSFARVRPACRGGRLSLFLTSRAVRRLTREPVCGHSGHGGKLLDYARLLAARGAQCLLPGEGS